MNKLIEKELPLESHKIEYKEAKNSVPKDFWRTYSAFANSEGGAIVLGVNDNLEIIGVNDSQKIMHEITTTLDNPQKVSMNVISNKDIQIIDKNAKKIILVNISEANYEDKPVYINNNLTNSYIRLHESNKKLNTSELKYFIRNSYTQQDNTLLENYTIDDLNTKTLAKYKDLLIEYSSINEKFKKLQYKDMLIELGAIQKDRTHNKYKLTLGGLLFFGKYNAIREFLPHFHLDYLNKISNPIRWKDRVSTGDAEDINIFEFYHKVLEKLKATVLDSFKLTENLKRISFTNDIEISLREALANSLIHTDYEYDMPVKVEAYDNHYIFQNPGSMRITSEEFARGGKSIPRNHIIITLFRRIGVCERAGTGGPQIFSSAKNNELRIPAIKSNNFSTKLTLWKVDIADSHPNLSDNAKELLKLLSKHMDSLSSSEIRESLNLSRHYFKKVIDELTEQNLIIKLGAGRSTKYALKQTSQEQIADLYQIIRELQDYHTKRN